MFKQTVLLLAVSVTILTNLYSQEMRRDVFLPEGTVLPARLPVLSIKTNLLHDLAATMNLGAEARLSDYLTLDLSASYNPWTFSDNRKWKHLLIQPELRYWIHEPFNGHYLGTHLLYNNYNIGNLDLPLDIFPELKDYRFQGHAWGAGFSYGYQWILSRRWNLEATFGFGYVYTDYSKYECHTCGRKTSEGSKHWFGPTKAGVSLIYIVK
ncbi:DUF3575 domain-containing protein [Dysgonomonas termitidis]|uniref:DUF3575 domain-containing protein n=1 Tax=Dysgonomonas termitidis TaxID=1516126 RepID=A0ABV9KTI9_9BACT